MAAILAVIFSNIASRLERFIGRFASSALVVATVVIAIVGLTYFLAVQLTAIAEGVTDHSENIARKINEVQSTTPEWLAHIEYGVKNIEQQLHAGTTTAKQHAPTMVQAPTGSPTVDQVLKPALPVLSDLTDGLLIIVLFFFLLYGREDLRYRLVRLTARIRVTLAAEAIATAGSTVSHYLLLFSLGQFWIRRLHRNRNVDSGPAKSGILGRAGFSAPIYTLCRSADFRRIANACRLRGFSGLV